MQDENKTESKNKNKSNGKRSGTMRKREMRNEIKVTFRAGLDFVELVKWKGIKMLGLGKCSLWCVIGAINSETIRGLATFKGICV